MNRCESCRNSIDFQLDCVERTIREYCRSQKEYWKSIPYLFSFYVFFPLGREEKDILNGRYHISENLWIDCKTGNPIYDNGAKYRDSLISFYQKNLLDAEKITKDLKDKAPKNVSSELILFREKIRETLNLRL